MIQDHTAVLPFRPRRCSLPVGEHWLAEAVQTWPTYTTRHLPMTTSWMYRNGVLTQAGDQVRNGT
jgi:hypothetical protein